MRCSIKQRWVVGTIYRLILEGINVKAYPESTTCLFAINIPLVCVLSCLERQVELQPFGQLVKYVAIYICLLLFLVLLLFYFNNHIHIAIHQHNYCEHPACNVQYTNLSYCYSSSILAVLSYQLDYPTRLTVRITKAVCGVQRAHSCSPTFMNSLSNLGARARDTQLYHG